jgi:hypothetical protein
MTIFAMVNAEKEGQIESKIMKARQLEEIREAKKKEAEARQSEKKNKLVWMDAQLRYNGCLLMCHCTGERQRINSSEPQTQRWCFERKVK